MVLPFLLLLVVAAPASAPANAPDESQPIIVTGRSLKDTERDLADCLARHCPPKEDIEASLAHAENLFVAGSIHAARSTLGAARARNIGFAKELPVEVADLTRAYGRMATFDGYQDVGRISQIDSLDSLKVGLDRDDARVLLQRLMVGDEYVRAGRLEAAEDVYDTVEDQARKAGLPRVLGMAMLRQAVVFGAVASVQPLYRSQARAKIVRLERTTDPELAPFRDAVGVLKARLAAIDGDEKALDAAIAELARKRPAARPVLVYAPEIDLDDAASPSSSIVNAVGEATPQWIDIAFEIGPDGRVRGLDVVRQSSSVGGTWPQRVQDSVRKRRYTPLAGGGVEEHVERFAFVYNVAAVTGSRIRARSPVGRIVTLDLTVDPPAGQRQD